jgi:hypothetical protein
MTDREKILIALREKPLKAFEIMKRVASGLPIALLKMREGGTGKFDIHKGHWLNVVQVSRRAEPYHSHTAERSKRAAWLVAYGTFEMCRPTPPMSVQGTDRIDRCISKLTRMDPERTWVRLGRLKAKLCLLSQSGF